MAKKIIVNRTGYNTFHKRLAEKEAKSTFLKSKYIERLKDGDKVGEFSAKSDLQFQQLEIAKLSKKINEMMASTLNFRVVRGHGDKELIDFDDTVNFIQAWSEDDIESQSIKYVANNCPEDGEIDYNSELGKLLYKQPAGAAFVYSYYEKELKEKKNCVIMIESIVKSKTNEIMEPAKKYVNKK